MNTCPLLIPVIALVAGILAERFGNLGLYVGLGCLIAGVAGIWSGVGSRKLHVIVYAGIALIFGGVGIVAAAGTPRSDERRALLVEEYGEWRKSLWPETPVLIEVQNVYTGEYGDRLQGVIAGHERWQGWGVTSFCGATAVSPGDLVWVSARSINGGYARNHEVIVAEKGASKHNVLAYMRRSIVKSIDESGLQSETQLLLRTLLTGEAGSVSPGMRRALSEAGLAHILALSGLHVGIAAGIILWLLWPLNLVGLWRLRLILALAGVWFFVLMSGGSDSTQRAAIMLTATITAVLLERQRDSFGALLIAAFVILLFSPDSLFDIGFQLSFLCVSALILFVEPLNPVSHRSHPVLYRISGALLVPLVATGASWVVSSYYFGIVPMGFLPLNILVLPLLPFYLGLAIFYLIIHGTWIDAEWIRYLLNKGCMLLREGAEIVGEGTVIEHRAELWQVWAWLLLLVISAWLVNRRSRNAKHPQPGHIA